MSHWPATRVTLLDRLLDRHDQQAWSEFVGLYGPGGTSMDEGLALALGEVEKHAGPGRLSRVVVLTDGETAGEQNCRLLAERARSKKIPLTLMGVGTDWKASLLKDLATISQGRWCYIDSTDSSEADRIFYYPGTLFPHWQPAASRWTAVNHR